MAKGNRKFFLFGHSVPKKGASKNEDACYPKSSVELEQKVVMALADGASGAIFAREWAETLVYAAVDRWRGIHLKELTSEGLFTMRIW